MAVFSTIGNIVAGNKQAKAAGKAADVSLDVARENNALAKDIYGQNKATLSPFVDRGNAAGGTINALLGLGGGQGGGQGAAQGQAAPANDEAWLSGLIDYVDMGDGPNGHEGRYLGSISPGMTVDQKLQTLLGTTKEPWKNEVTQKIEAYKALNARPSMQPQGQVAGTTQTQTAQQAAEGAFDTFRDSTNYQWRLNEGLGAVNNNWAGGGALQSGAAMQAISDYGQNTASNELMNYMGLLSNQQGVGLSGASALAGVGQNYSNSVAANNNAGGTAQANALLAGGAAQANTWSSIGNGLGQVAGIFAGGGF